MSTEQKIQRFVWTRFLILVVLIILLLTPVAACMLIAWLFRMLSRIISFIAQKISLFLFSLLECAEIHLGFIDPPEPDVTILPQPDENTGQ